MREVASVLHVSPALVYKLCERHELRSLRIGGALRFQEAAVQPFLAALERVIREGRRLRICAQGYEAARAPAAVYKFPTTHGRSSGRGQGGRLSRRRN